MPPTTTQQLRFQTLDVFTTRAFGGNPLAIFPDTAQLPTELLQNIAREMNLSESVFLGEPRSDDGAARLRIFTPAREIPFSGHPTIGTALYLHWRESALDPSHGSRRDAQQPGAGSKGWRSFVLEEGVGPVPVRVRQMNPKTAGLDEHARTTQEANPETTLGTIPEATAAATPEANIGITPEVNPGAMNAFAELEVTRSEHRPAEHPVKELAAMIGLAESDVCDPREHGTGIGFESEMVSCGLPYYIIPVRSHDALRRCSLDLVRWRELGVATGWADHVYVIFPCSNGFELGSNGLEPCGDHDGKQEQGLERASPTDGPPTVWVRMFAPGSGVPEDPATGSAAAALGSYIGRRLDRDGVFDCTVRQGIEMGRPSTIHVRWECRSGRVRSVWVGGHAIPVCEGTLTLPLAGH